MLSIGRVAPGGSGYYLNTVASTPDGYYLGSGEAPGIWVGAAADTLDLAGQVDPEVFRRVLDGCHPTSGERLVPGGERRVGGFDLTFSAPKSVSLLWALHPDPEVAGTVAGAHRAAIGDALAYLEADALCARRGAGGRIRVPVGGLVGAAFDHRSSRAGDPQLHTHVVVANLVVDRAGRWSAPDGRGLYRHARTAGFVYQARLRHDLTTRLGVRWGPIRSGQADLAGITRDVIDRFSTRRAQVTTALEARGLSTSAAARVATLDTRPDKPAVDPLGLQERWAVTAHAADVDVTGLVEGARSPHVPPPDRMVDGLVGPDGLTAHASTFDRRALIGTLAAAHRDGATLITLSDLAQEVMLSPAVVDLGGGQPGGAERRWTTVDLLALEADLEARATRAGSSTDTLGVADATQLGRALNARPHLSGEQTDVVAGICFATEPVVTVVGKAGTGKTFTLDAARDAWTASGVPVVGAALAARAAAELQAGSGIPSTTLARLLGDIERPEGRLVPGSVIVVDEAGMVGTRDLHRLITAAADQQAKVVLVGDPAQLPEIAAGGSFARLVARTPNNTLTANRRQSQPWERAALDELRDRQPRPALARYGDHGRITLAANGDDLRRQMIDDWHTGRDTGESVVMLAVRRTDVADLNRRAQQRLIAAGALDPEAGTVALPGGQTVLVGDEIVCGRNDRRAGLINGTRLTVTGLDADHNTITGTAHQPGAGPTVVTIAGGYVTQGHVGLGYASTIHKAQGRTVDRALLLGDDRLFAEAGYVGLSRGRTQNQLYVVADTNPLHTGPQPGAGLAESVCQALGVSHAQTVAADHVADPIPDAALPVLVTERDRLTDQLITTMPPPARTGLDPQHAVHDARPRHDWTVEHRRDGERLARLTAAVDRRHQHLGLAALIDTPDHVTRLLGPPPDTPQDRQAWTETAAAVEAWRELSGRSATHGNRHLLAEPGIDRAEHPWWQRATRRLDTYQSCALQHSHQAQLTATPDRDLPDRDLPDLDRSWRPTPQRGLNR